MNKDTKNDFKMNRKARMEKITVVRKWKNTLIFVALLTLCKGDNMRPKFLGANRVLLGEL